MFSFIDICTGMNEVSLHRFLTRFPTLVTKIFPSESERIIHVSNIKAAISYEGKDLNEDNERAAVWFNDYLDDIETHSEGRKGLINNRV